MNYETKHDEMHPIGDRFLIDIFLTNQAKVHKGGIEIYRTPHWVIIAVVGRGSFFFRGGGLRENMQAFT